MIDTIVSDVDGTLLNSQHQITPRTSSALKRALDSGVSLILATGKTFASTCIIREHLKLNTPGVYVQGLVICDGKGVVQEQTLLHKAVVKQVEQIARQHDLAVIAYGGTELYVSSSGKKRARIGKGRGDTRHLCAVGEKDTAVRQDAGFAPRGYGSAWRQNIRSKAQ